jgi:hypothetical protein
MHNSRVISSLDVSFAILPSFLGHHQIYARVHHACREWQLLVLHRESAISGASPYQDEAERDLTGGGARD